ncbi:MAG: malto-oligosyltrehalose trehalohydrolase [Candidatus Tectimicrobiota bacterium]
MALPTSLDYTLGATWSSAEPCRFLVWAPFAHSVEVHLHTPRERYIAMRPESGGYYMAEVADVPPGSLYTYRLDRRLERPDPASRCQPQGVHGPSQVVDAAFPWEDTLWQGVPLQHYILYEIHVGTYTVEGTFAALIPHLPELKRLGITAVELMPVAQFPGARNWGYDGVQPFAAHSAYGGPAGLKNLVNACHQQGLAVVLDVVYNHIGPEGNILGDFAPYFTERYKTPWGAALNFDGPLSDDVRRFFIENALYWLTECHIDALRLDAVHAIYDRSAYPFLEELHTIVQAQATRLKRQIYLIAESSLNDPRLVLPSELGGIGLHAQWNDDFHHALHAILTGERDGYYQDFGQMAHLSAAWRDGYVYSGQYALYRQRRHGRSSRVLPAHALVVCAQNHDQIGNRRLGERLSQLLSFEQLKLTAAVVLLSPYIPLLFMGEEYGETAPFQYFVSHTDPALVEAVRQGRRNEFAAFQWQGQVLEPQDEATFLVSKLNHELRQQEPHRTLWAFTQALIGLRTSIATLATLDKEAMEVRSTEEPRVLAVRRWSRGEEVLTVFHFGSQAVPYVLPISEGPWHKQLDSTDQQWQGPGSSVPLVLQAPAETEVLLPPSAVLVFVHRHVIALTQQQEAEEPYRDVVHPVLPAEEPVVQSSVACEALEQEDEAH